MCPLLAPAFGLGASSQSGVTGQSSLSSPRKQAGLGGMGRGRRVSPQSDGAGETESSGTSKPAGGDTVIGTGDTGETSPSPGEASSLVSEQVH